MTAKKKRARATGLSEKTDQQLTHTPAEQESQALVEHVEAIRAVGKRVLSDVVEIGRRLTECRRIVGHGKWLAWLEHEFRWSQQTAARFMQVFEFAGKVSKLENLELPVSSLYLLTAPSTPLEVRDQIAERANAGELITREVVAEILPPVPSKQDKVAAESIFDTWKVGGHYLRPVTEAEAQHILRSATQSDDDDEPDEPIVSPSISVADTAAALLTVFTVAREYYELETGDFLDEVIAAEPALADGDFMSIRMFMELVRDRALRAKAAR
jgi:Protein of unknown function (DUF3102)